MAIETQKTSEVINPVIHCPLCDSIKIWFEQKVEYRQDDQFKHGWSAPHIDHSCFVCFECDHEWIGEAPSLL